MAKNYPITDGQRNQCHQCQCNVTNASNGHSAAWQMFQMFEDKMKGFVSRLSFSKTSNGWTLTLECETFNSKMLTFYNQISILCIYSVLLVTHALLNSSRENKCYFSSLLQSSKVRNYYYVIKIFQKYRVYFKTIFRLKTPALLLFSLRVVIQCSTSNISE